ncbi:unnamed protein product [Rotaria sp. Silwood2]|nr:unnamed protein product [Rotaria sp. Silwood2]
MHSFCLKLSGINSSYYQNNYIGQTESRSKNYSNSYNSKESNTIKCLQKFLENKTNDSFIQQQMDYSINEKVKYSSSTTNNDNSHWSSTKTKSDTIVQNNNNNNNQKFTYSDAEKLLTMVQRLRN